MEDETTTEREEMRERFPELKGQGSKLDRAIDVVLAGGVKETVFLPSGRKIITVIGSLGDEFINPQKPYCSCSNFFFRVLGGGEETCYHLLSYIVAARTGRLDVVKFDDDEYGDYFAATARDVFEVIRKSGH